MSQYLNITHNPMSIYSQYRQHFHSSYEVYYFLEGNADYLVEGNEYHLTPYSIILLAPYVHHSIRVNSDAVYRRCTLYFSPTDITPERSSFLLSVFPNSKRSQQVVYYENVKDYHFEDFYQNLQSAETLPPFMQTQCHSIFLESFLAQVHIMCQNRCPSSVSTTAPSVITDIIEYLNNHIVKQHSLDELSERFHISKYYMNKLFKKTTGMTVIDYLIFKRVVLSKQYILNGENAANAALMVGFSDYSSFYRAYKRVLGTSPSTSKELRQ